MELIGFTNISKVSGNLIRQVHVHEERPGPESGSLQQVVDEKSSTTYKQQSCSLFEWGGQWAGDKREAKKGLKQKAVFGNNPWSVGKIETWGQRKRWLWNGMGKLYSDQYFREQQKKLTSC